MFIYQIRNKINGKSYIGQSVRKNFNYRYSGGRWWDITKNPILKAAHKKHGIKNIEIVILDKNVESIDRLNELEEKYIAELNTVTPYGYNIKKGGDNHEIPLKTREKIKKAGVKSRNKCFKFKNNYTDKIISGDCLSDICRKYKLNIPQMCQVNNGSRKVHRGFSKASVNIKRTALISPKGNIVIVLENDFKPFCKEYKFDSATFFAVKRGIALTHKGWKFALENKNGEIYNPRKKSKKIEKFRKEEYIKLPRVANKGKEIKFKNNFTGETVTTNNISKFAKERNLPRSSMIAVAKNDRARFYRGWTLISTDWPALYLLSPNNCAFIVYKSTFDRFCEDHDLNSPTMRNVLVGRPSYFSDWKISNKLSDGLIYNPFL